MNYTRVFSLEESIFVKNVLVPVMLVMWISMLVKIAQDCIVFIITYAQEEEENGHGDGAFRENMEEGGQRANWRAQTPIVSNTRSHIYRRQGAHKRSKQSKNLSDSDLNPVKQKYTSDFRLRAISAQPLRDSGQVLETVQASEYFI